MTIAPVTSTIRVLNVTLSAIVYLKLIAHTQDKMFARFARKEGITNEYLTAAIEELENGLSDGDLGSGLVKKRIARRGAGKRGSYRAIIAFRAKKRAILVYGFAKSVVENLDEVELRGYRKLAQNSSRV